MTTYTAHADALFDPDKPILGSTQLEQRDNLIAVTEGGTDAPRIQGLALAGPADVPTITVSAAATVVRNAPDALGLGYVEGTVNATEPVYVVGATFTVSQAYAGSLRFYATHGGTYTGVGNNNATSSMYLRKNGVTISPVFSASSGGADRSVDSDVASGDIFEWMHRSSGGVGDSSTMSNVRIGGSDLYVAATPMILASQNPF